MRPRPIVKLQYHQSTFKITRVGECNNCGVCCQLWRHPNASKDSPFYAEKAHYGFCDHYNPDATAGHCRIWNKRNQVCREFPRGPMDVLNKPQCSYMFFDEKGCRIDAYMDKRVRLIKVGEVSEREYPFQGRF